MTREQNASWPDLTGYYCAWLAYRQWYLRVPGVQMALRRDGELVTSAALGHADLRTGAALTSRHLFRIASHSKTFTGVAVLQLAEQGRLRLDDPVATHVPQLTGAPLGTRTIGELLSHSAGVIRDGLDGDFWQLGRPFPTQDELVAWSADADAAILAANEHFKYSNIGYGLLGLVVEAASGLSYSEYVRTRIAEPLELADTGAELDPDRAADYAAGHSALSTADHREVIPHVDTRALAAATGCFATAADLTAFYSALLPGDTRLLSPESQRRQQHRQWNIKGEERGYGLGVFLDRLADIELFGHTGGYPGHITCTYADPQRREVLAVLTNAIDGAASGMAEGYLRLLALGRDAKHATCGPDAVRFTGRFAGLWGVKDVIRIDDRLFSVNPAAPDPAEDAAPLEVAGDAALRIVGGRGGNSYGETMTYEFAADGTVVSMRADSSMTLRPFTIPEGPPRTGVR